MSAAHDVRLDLVANWVRAVLGSNRFTLAPASADASFRRYFRITPDAPWRGHPTLIAMDAPPPMENCRPYMHVAKLLADAGVHAPEVLAADPTRGFLLLTDLGTRTYLSALDASSAPALYSDAIDALIRWQAATRDDEALRVYDDALLMQELALFPDWYVARRLGRKLSPAQGRTLGDAFRLIVAHNLGEPRV